MITSRSYVSAVADSLPYPTTTSVACSPVALTLPASASCTATVTDTATLGAPTGTVAFSATGLGSFGSPASCSLLATAGTQSTCQLTFTPSLAGAQTITAAYVGDVRHAPSSGTASFTALAPQSCFVPPPAKPSNLFVLSRPKLNRRSGSAILNATLPGPGKLRLTGRGITLLTRLVSHAGTVKLMINGQPKTQRILERTGTATVTVKVTYTPTGGDPNTKSRKLNAEAQSPMGGRSSGWPTGGGPAASVATGLFGTWPAARTAALLDAIPVMVERSSARASPLGTQASCVPNRPESAAKSANPRGGESCG